MTHDAVKYHLDTNPSLRLLRSANAPLIVSFLYSQFKKKPRITVPQSEMTEALEDLLSDLRAVDPDCYPAGARKYLSAWCSDHHAFLRKYYEAGSDDPVYELTPDSERAIQWLEDLDKAAFIGTESRFLQIVGLLDEIVQESTEDPEARLAQLRRQQEEIEARIEKIEATGEVDRFNTTQIKERFFKASDEARRLLADFREVDANFRDVTRQIQERRLLEDATQGDIVGYVLDADDALSESDQGRSFDAFWQFLVSPSRKRELRQLLEDVFSIPELEEFTRDGSLLKHIVRHLSEAGERIVHSNRRLAEQLRRMLEEAQLRENRRVFELVDAIKKVALATKNAPPKERDFIDLEGRPNVQLFMERPLWNPPTRPTFENQPEDIDESVLEEFDLSQLFDLFAVERDQLERHIATVLQDRSQATLIDITDRFPVERGLSEVITYMAIASDTDRHLIDDTQKEPVVVRSPHRPTRQVVLPRIIFTR